MDKKETIYKMERERDAIKHLKNNQVNRPFNCPHLLVVHEDMKHGSTLFRKGDILCTSNFLDICQLFSRARADEEGNIIARCCKIKGELMVKFRSNQ